MSILRDHALKYVWAEPLQDFQHKIKPNRVSPNGGYYKEGGVMWESIPMPNYWSPESKSKFHVYPLGQLPPKRFGVDMKPIQWYRGDDLSRDSDNVVDVYADNGAIIPRDKFYICQNYDKNLILAVSLDHGDIGTETITTVYDEVMEVPYSLNRHGLTVRFYHNALIENREWMTTVPVPEQPLTDVRKVIKSIGDYTTFMAEVKAVDARYGGYGAGVFFRDGFLVETPTGFKDTYIGTTYGYQYDETVKDIRDFPILTIPGFISTLDVRQPKYLLISDKRFTYLDYFDDCDFYLMLKQLDGKIKGVRIDVFGETVVRQVTHTAWSVNQNEIIRLAGLHTDLRNVQLLTIRVVVRQGGMIRGVGLQHNRIEELYHLTNEQIQEAMVGANALIPEWRAEELESSDYMKLMSSEQDKITDDVVENAYGYNAATRAVGKTNVKKIDNEFILDPGMCLPYDLFNPKGTQTETRRSFTWYDADGKYLGMIGNTSTSTKAIPGNAYANAAKLEVMLGTFNSGINDNGTITDTEVVTDNDFNYFGYRCYVCNIVGSGPDHKWVDVTDTNLYTYTPSVDGKAPTITWNYALLNAANYYPAVRIANKVNLYNPVYSDSTFTGVFEYAISRLQNSRIMVNGVPPGHVDVFMNGKLLIPDLDYYYRGSGNVYIVAKPTTTVTNTKIYIRTYGYMNPKTNKPFGPRAVGFVKNGLLTVNDKFDIFHDRDVRVIMNGRLMRVEEVQFAEDEIREDGPIFKDGAPFAICDYQAFVEPYTDQQTIPYIMTGMDIDERVGDYLSDRIEPLHPDNEYITPERHILYSPVMAIFTQMFITGKLTDAVIDLEATDQTILTLFGPLVMMYQDIDPIILGYDKDYVYIEPHPFITPPTVTSKQHAFLERVNRIFLKETLDISGHYTIKAGT